MIEDEMALGSPSEIDKILFVTKLSVKIYYGRFNDFFAAVLLLYVQ